MGYEQNSIEVMSMCLENGQLNIIMPLQETNLGSPTMGCSEDTEQIHRTLTLKCDPNKTA